MDRDGPTGLHRVAGAGSPGVRVAVLAVLLTLSSAGSTDQAQGTLGVSATVMPVARLALAGNEPDLLLTSEDVARGYVESPRPLHLTVYSNSRSGYALDVLPLSPLFSTIEVHGLGSSVVLTAEGGTVTQRWTRPQTVTLELNFSFTLAQGLEPGLYPWPVRLAARPLDQ